MADKSHEYDVLKGQLSKKARRTLQKPTRSRAINLRAFKLRRQKKLSKKVAPDPAKDWSAMRVKDELTNLVSFVIAGPTKGGDTFKVSIPAENREELNRVRKTLRSYEAALPSQVDDALEFIEKLFDAANVSPLIATSRPGFTETGKGLGTREGWNEQVGKLLQHSSFATIAVLAVLASPVPAYVLLRKSEDCPSSDDLRQFGCFREGGSGSSVVEKRHAGDAANDDLRWSGV
jgi:hypothetical protein